MKPKNLQVRMVRSEKVLTVYLVGEAHIDFDDADAHIKTILAGKPGQVVVDASQLTFVSSVGMCFLISLRRALNDAGGKLVLRGLQPQVRKVMEQAHVIDLFNVEGAK